MYIYIYGNPYVRAPQIQRTAILFFSPLASGLARFLIWRLVFNTTCGTRSGDGLLSTIHDDFGAVVGFTTLVVIGLVLKPATTGCSHRTIGLVLPAILS